MILRALRFATAWILSIALLVSACGSGDFTPTDTAGSGSAQVTAHLNELIAVMQTSSINRFKIDWTAFRTSVFAKAAGAQSIQAAYSAIREAMALLGDEHSSYRAPDGSVIAVRNLVCTATTATAPQLPVTIGYVRIEAFSGGGAPATEFANSIQSSIRASDRAELVGWIVDLRGNGGGNMWPMLAGIGPILGEGIAGYFIDPTDVRTAWEYREGASWNGGAVSQRTDNPYRLRRDRPRVAVLTDNRVASSGEGIVIAFKQRPDTRSFGTPTCGLSTANRGFALSNGALLNLTVAPMADRQGSPYGSSVLPDEIITSPDQAVQRALAWLQS
jgi:C-terminal processing protease CtpA/Prc